MCVVPSYLQQFVTDILDNNDIIIGNAHVVYNNFVNVKIKTNLLIYNKK